MKKNSNKIINSAVEKSQSAVAQLVSHAQLLEAWVANGERIFQVGRDLVRVKADGQIETIEGFFDVSEMLALNDLPAEVLAQWQAAMGQVEHTGRLVAQAAGETATATDAGAGNVGSNAGAGAAANPEGNAAGAAPAATDAAAAPVGVPIAKVAEASGGAQIMRNGAVLSLSVGDDVYLGDVISTQANSKVKLNFVKVGENTLSSSAATVGAASQVTVMGQVLTVDNARIFQANLKVDTGTVAVDKVTVQDVRVQVETPVGRVPVPADGLNVTVQPERYKPR